MSQFAIGLVLLSAVLHALWNFIAKRAIGGTSFVWLFSVIEAALYLPVLFYFLFIAQVDIGLPVVIFMAGSGLLHLLYFVLLSKGYQVGDLSLVYPLARAIGPLISTFAAILLFQERPTLLAFIGGLLVCGGVFWLTGDPRKLRKHDALPGVMFASFTGLSIAAYTLWDSYAVSQMAIAPLMFQSGYGISRVILLTPIALRDWPSVQRTWDHDKWKAASVAVLSSLAYVLILIALSFNPVSYVAPMRVISTLIGVALGASLLKEGDMARRLVAAAVMVIGVFALSLG